MHAHAPINQFQPSRADEPLHSILDHVVLVPPPSLEKCLLDIDELAVLVFEQGRDERIQNVLHTCPLDGVVGSDVVLVDGLEPPDVVVGVRHHVHVELPGHHPRRRVVGDVHRLARGGQRDDGEEGESDGAHGGGGRGRRAERGGGGGAEVAGGL